MNIQSFSPAFQNTSMPGFAARGPQNSMLMMMQMMMQLMMSLMQMQMSSGGQAMMMGNSPNFGGGACGCGSPGFSGGGGGMPGFGGFGGGGAGMPGSSNPAGPFNSRDSYVPGGTNQTGAVGNLGSGQGSDAVRWALSKEGISESNNPAAVRGFSRGRWQAWCADFVSQAYANSPGGSPFGHQSSVAGILNWGRQNNKFFDAGTASSNPSMLKPGDIAVWKSNGKSHVGLVTGVNPNGTFSTIEGNSGDAVRRRTHSFGAGLTGFVRPRG